MAEPLTSSTLPPLRIGTRKSNLAVIQTEGIRDRLQQLAPGRTFEITALRTVGDKDQKTALYDFGAKNMPTSLPPSCDLAAIPLRDDPRDALIVKSGLPYTSLATLPQGAIVGTSSVRRSAQLRRLHPHLRFANLRGNVETRLAKVDDPESEYVCMIMSACGLERVGLAGRITQYLGSKDGGILHAVGQGALGLEIRRDDVETRELLGGLGDEKSGLACLAERALMRELEGGCSVPIGVETEWIGGVEQRLRMRAIVVSIDGSQSVEDTIDATVQTEDEATALGLEMAARLVEAGAGAILKDINTNRPAKD
ncbi:hypothetical protein V502_04472 [Pseudogymnoascus sp. VKM F-4520 (FW-2644)]|nr:hypothetical protein V502_04472 [Pseudogymnoascus sp. VKM F-4520 (FW-2644)]